jgi:hypothetical protein
MIISLNWTYCQQQKTDSPKNKNDSLNRIMACDILMALNELKLQEDSNSHENLEGIIDKYCGCMISKWISVEFQEVIASNQEKYLHVVFVYLEPFTDFDHYDFFLSSENIPSNVMKLYQFAFNNSRVEVSDDIIELYAPYVYKDAKALLKKYNKDNIVGMNKITESMYISSPKDIKEIDALFETLFV